MGGCVHKDTPVAGALCPDGHGERPAGDGPNGGEPWPPSLKINKGR